MTFKNNISLYVGGFTVIAILVVFALWYASDSEFDGADTAAGNVIGEVDPDYELWYDGIFGDYELPGETENMFFAIQAAIGAIIIGYFIGRYTKSKSEKATEASVSETIEE